MESKKEIMLKKSLLIVLFLLMISMASALETYKQNSDIDLKVACYNDGAKCSSGASCNLTVSYPNGTLMINDQTMTQDGHIYNYSIPNTNIIGEYTSTAYCVDGLNSINEDFNFIISSTGETQRNNIPFLFVGLFLFAVFYIIMSRFLEGKNQETGEQYFISKKLVVFCYVFAFFNLISALFITLFSDQYYYPESFIKLTFYMNMIVGFGVVLMTLLLRSLVFANPLENEKENNKWSNNKW